MRQNNYEITKRRVQAEFPTRDLRPAVQKFGLKADADDLYLNFCSRDYRIDRKSGVVRWSEDGFLTCTEAGFNEVLTIFDLLFDSAPDCTPDGSYCRVNSLPGLVKTAAAPADDTLISGPVLQIQEDPDAFRRACERLGGKPYGIGDISYRLPVFGPLCAVVQFWFADEDFGPQLQMFWDRNLLQYLRYETVWYLYGHLLHRISELL